MYNLSASENKAVFQEMLHIQLALNNMGLHYTSLLISGFS